MLSSAEIFLVVSRGHQCLSMLKRFLHLFAIVALVALPALAQRYAFRQYGQIGRAHV